MQVARLRVDIRSPEEEFFLAVSEDVMSNQVVQQNLTDSNEVQLSGKWKQIDALFSPIKNLFESFKKLTSQLVEAALNTGQ